MRDSGFGMRKTLYPFQSKTIFERQKKHAAIGSSNPKHKTKHPELVTTHSPLAKIQNRHNERIVGVAMVIAVLLVLTISIGNALT